MKSRNEADFVPRFKHIVLPLRELPVHIVNQHQDAGPSRYEVLLHFFREEEHLFFAVGVLLCEDADELGDGVALLDGEDDLSFAVENEVEPTAEVGLDFDVRVHEKIIYKKV